MLYLQHAYRMSDEAVVTRSVENSYYQRFAGETFFQHRGPIEPSSLTRWRKRLGEEGAEWLLVKYLQILKTIYWFIIVTPKTVIFDSRFQERFCAGRTNAQCLRSDGLKVCHALKRSLPRRTDLQARV